MGLDTLDAFAVVFFLRPWREGFAKNREFPKVFLNIFCGLIGENAPRPELLTSKNEPSRYIVFDFYEDGISGVSDGAMQAIYTKLWGLQDS